MAILRDAGFDAEAPQDLLAWIRDDQRQVVLLTIVAESDWSMLGAVLHVRPDTVLVAMPEPAPLDAYVRALRAGAAGVIPRSSDPASIRRVLIDALDGVCSVPIDAVRALVRSPQGDTRVPAASPAEIQWLRRLAEGATVGRLADESGYSERMMFRLLRALYTKLGASSRMEAIINARDEGWITQAPG